MEHGEECVYEAVKPRQRRKRETAPIGPVDANSSSSGSDRALRPGSNEPYGIDSVIPEDVEYNPLAGNPIASPMDSLFAWSPRDLPILSPMDPNSFQYPIISNTGFPNEDDDVEEIIRQDSMPLVSATTQSTRIPTLALIAPVNVPSPLFEFSSPVYAEFSERTNRRALVDHFCNVLSHLIVFREECGNPFQQLVLPMCHNSQSVTNAVYALASAHLEFRGVENKEKSMYFHNKSIQGLARLIERGADGNRNELLAAIMLLVYYEVVSSLQSRISILGTLTLPQLVQRGRSNIVDGHLKGAMTIMGNSQPASDPTGVFLERVGCFQYVSVWVADKDRRSGFTM